LEKHLYERVSAGGRIWDNRGLLPRVYPILDIATLRRLEADPFQAAEALLEGGARILQLRHKEFWSREMFHLAHRLSTRCREAGSRFVINDRADCAALTGSGLHLGQEDLTPEDARIVVGPLPVVGFSTHSAEQMQAAAGEPVDYVAFGPVFPTASKEQPSPTVGLEQLRAVREMTSRPLVAIGGITRENAALCWAAGADSVAVIADLHPVPWSAAAMRQRMTEWRRLGEQFDQGLNL